ncbi:MAG: hypothetical protein ACM3KD_08555 [Hyphomicrobiaceae bacterium]
MSVRLAHALHQIGRTLLMVDTQGRLFGASFPRSLFDWKRQLERRQLHTLPQAYGEGWFAPGIGTDEPALTGLVNGYDHVLFDAGWDGAEPARLPGAAHTVVIEIRRTEASMLHAYALLKTLAYLGGVYSVGLLGDHLACERVRVAACRFLGQRCARSIFSVAHEIDAFAALAVRMADEETRLRAR